MMKRILAIMISLALLLGCAAAETATETETRAYEIEMKGMPFYLMVGTEIWKPDFPVYFINGVEDLPFVDMNDWVEYLNAIGPRTAGEGFKLSAEVIEAENRIVLTRDNGVTVEVDFDQQAIRYIDYLAFMQEAGGRYMDFGSLPDHDAEGRPFMISYTGSRDLYGDFTVLDLKQYGIPMIAQDGKYLLPLQTLSAFINPVDHTAVYFNGQALFMSVISNMTDPFSSFWANAQLSGAMTTEMITKANTFKGSKEEQVQAILDMVKEGSELGAQLVDQYQAGKATNLYVLYNSVPKTPRSEALCAFGYNELCLELDCFYGLKDIHNITDFNLFFLQNGLKEKLLDPDATKADEAIAELVDTWFDDIHSTFGSPSCYSDYSLTGVYGFDSLAHNNLRMKLPVIKSRHPESLQPYYEVGDTAYVTINSFNTGKDGTGPSGFTDYYKSAEEGTLQEDTIATIIKAHQQITRENSPIKNVVLDLSANTGGEVTAALYMLGWYLGNGNVSVRNQFTGAQTTMYARSDVNLDRLFDEQDTVMDRDINLYCLISPVSFSSGNLVPWVLKADGRVTLLGKTSGGGSCMIGDRTTAWGTSFHISSYSRLSFVKNGAYYDVDKGVEPDHVIDSYDHFYDREALTEYIHSLY